LFAFPGYTFCSWITVFTPNKDAINSQALKFYVLNFGFSLVNREADALLRQKLAEQGRLAEEDVKRLIAMNPDGLRLDISSSPTSSSLNATRYLLSAENVSSPAQIIPCNVCGSYSSEIAYKIHVAGFDYTFVKCKECGLIYMHPQPTPEHIVSLYSKSYYKTDNSQSLG